MKKIVREQIDILYDFTRKHYVEHYDLQTELVDHLANDIEAQWAVIDTLSFDKALDVAFKKFGVFGFTEVIDKRKAAMEKRYNRIILRHVINFVGSSKILYALSLLFVCFYVTTQLQYGLQVVFVFGGVSYLAFVVSAMINFKKYRKATQHSSKKRWLFEEQINNYGMGTVAFFIPYYFYLVFMSSDGIWNSDSQLLVYLVPVFVTFTAVIMYVLFVEIPRYARIYLEQTYPEFTLVGS